MQIHEKCSLIWCNEWICNAPPSSTSNSTCEISVYLQWVVLFSIIFKHFKIILVKKHVNPYRIIPKHCNEFMFTYIFLTFTLPPLCLLSTTPLTGYSLGCFQFPDLLSTSITLENFLHFTDNSDLTNPSIYSYVSILSFKISLCK